MSFVRYKELLFDPRGRRVRRKPRRLENPGPRTDPRSWSNDPNRRRDYFIDSVVYDTAQSSCEEDVPELGREPSVANEFESGDAKIQKFLDIKVLEIEKLRHHNCHLRDENMKILSEVDNLRKLVTDLKEQKEYLESFKTIVEQSKTDSDPKQELEEAKEEIQHLLRQIELYNDMKEKYSSLRLGSEHLRRECGAMKRTITQLESEKLRMSEILKKREEEVLQFNTRSIDVSTAVAEKKVLRERINARDERIQQITRELENKENLVQELTAEMEKHNRFFQEKEESLQAQIGVLKAALDERTGRVVDLESKLERSELLVGQLEILRDQFRVNNSVLKENLSNYRAQFEKAVHSADLISCSVQSLQEEVDAKEKALEKMNLFPQNPKTMIHFAHLHKLVASAGDFEESNLDQMKSLMANIQHIISVLKTEMWGNNSMPEQLCIEDSSVQVVATYEDKTTQILYTVSDQEVQSEFVDEYVQAKELVEKLQLTVYELEMKLGEQEEELDSVETRLMNSFEETTEKEKEIDKLKEANALLQEKIQVLNVELSHADSLLNAAVKEIDSQIETQEQSSSLFESALSSTVSEYNSYIDVLEGFIEYKEDRINILIGAVDEANLDQGKMQELVSAVSKLTEELQGEKELSTELGSELAAMLAAMVEKTKRISEIEEKLEKSGRTVDELNDVIANSTTGLHQVESQLEEYKTAVAAQEVTVHDLMEKLRSSESIRQKLKRDVRRGTNEKKLLKKKISALSIELRKGKKVMSSSSMQSEPDISETYERAEVVSRENLALIRDRDVYLGQIKSLRGQVAELEEALLGSQQRDIEHEEYKMMAEKIILKHMKRLVKYKSALKGLNVVKEWKTTQTDEDVNDVIDRLKEENKTMVDTIQNLKLKFKEMFKCQETKSCGIQVESGESMMDPIKEHYERIIDTLGKESAIEKEQIHKKYTTNLKMLQECYERDIKALKAENALNSAKLEEQHTIEMEELKRTADVLVATEKEKIREMVYQDEVDSLRADYEIKLLELEAERLRVTETLTQKLSEMQIEKDATVESVRAEMTDLMSTLKKKFKKQTNKFKEQFRFKMERAAENYQKELSEGIKNALEERAASRVDHGVQCTPCTISRQTGDSDNCVLEYGAVHFGVNTESVEPRRKILGITVQESIHYEVEGDSGAVNSAELMQILPYVKRSNEETVDYSDVSLLEKIALLERQIVCIQNEAMRRAHLYEKKIKHEEMKSQEIANILDEELRYTSEVHMKLGYHFKTAKRLQNEKEELKSQLEKTEKKILILQNLLDKEKDKNMSMKKVIGKLKAEPQGSQQLEESLNRLRDKIDQAVECEKRLSQELTNDYREELLKPEKEETKIEEAQRQEAEPLTESDDSLVIQKSLSEIDESE